MRRTRVRASAVPLLIAALAVAPAASGDDKTKSPASALGKASVAAGASKVLKGPQGLKPGPPGEAKVRPSQKWPRFRANLEALNARLKGSLPALRAMSTAAPTPTPVNRLTAGGPGAGKSLGALGGGPNPALGTGGGAGKNLDTLDCARNPVPSLSRFEGDVTPSGFLVLRGSCLGTTKGQVFISGRFPGNALKLTPEEWTDHYATVVVPDVIGIGDHGVTIKVFAGGKFSNELAASFVARRERLEVPWRFVRSVLCTHQDYCRSDAESGIWAGHNATNPVEDVDTWELKLPDGWELDDIRWKSFLPPSPTAFVRYAGGAENGPPNYAKWNMRWRSECEGGLPLGSDYCYVGYQLHVFAWGPVGTMTP
jgi:hypothetical protein